MFTPIDPEPLYYTLDFQGKPLYYGDYKAVIRKLKQWNIDYKKFTLEKHNCFYINGQYGWKVRIEPLHDKDKPALAARIRNNTIKQQIKQAVSQYFKLHKLPQMFWASGEFNDKLADLVLMDDFRRLVYFSRFKK